MSRVFDNNVADFKSALENSMMYLLSAAENMDDIASVKYKLDKTATDGYKELKITVIIKDTGNLEHTIADMVDARRAQLEAELESLKSMGA